MKYVFQITIMLMFCSFQTTQFKTNQLTYTRVRQAYADKEKAVERLLNEKNIKKEYLEIYLRAFKHEKELELWGKNNTDDAFTLLKTYNICRTSGKSGPKRKQGDIQIPEGFYHIDRFNPYSNFYLSLGINYPNASDKILGEKGNLGGDIFIHGACVTIGCLPITDDQIKELYVFCAEARNNGQLNIPVTIFPARLTTIKFKELSEKYKTDEDEIGLWTDLKAGFDKFNESKKLPSVMFKNTGRHNIQ